MSVLQLSHAYHAAEECLTSKIFRFGVPFISWQMCLRLQVVLLFRIVQILFCVAFFFAFYCRGKQRCGVCLCLVNGTNFWMYHNRVVGTSDVMSHMGDPDHAHAFRPVKVLWEVFSLLEIEDLLLYTCCAAFWLGYSPVTRLLFFLCSFWLHERNWNRNSLCSLTLCWARRSLRNDHVHFYKY